MKTFNSYLLAMIAGAGLFVFTACDDDDEGTRIHEISSAEDASVDRFSADAGTLMVRDATNGLPAANTAVNFDQGPFITKGLGPMGEVVEYYNFDVQSTTPAPIYVLFRDGESSPVAGQLNIIDVAPGDAQYNDFWIVNKVNVPADYKANEVASFSEITSKGYSIEATTTIVNCPVVPKGSTASKRLGGGPSGLNMGWYKEKIAYYFTFEEKALTAAVSKVPVSPIYVCFNINVTETGGGPGSGFKVEPGTMQTHNVVATVPADGSYSPLWLVSAYDNAAFADVDDLAAAQSADHTNLGATVNCPIVSVE